MSGFLDTNVVVRYLTGSPAALAEQAATIIDGDQDLYITDVVLAEVGHVLTSIYGVPRESIVDQIVALLRRGNVHLLGMDKDLAIQGLLFCRPSNRVSFPDALIWAAAQSFGPRVVYTFDRRFPAENVEVRRSFSTS